MIMRYLNHIVPTLQVSKWQVSILKDRSLLYGQASNQRPIRHVHSPFLQSILKIGYSYFEK